MCIRKDKQLVQDFQLFVDDSGGSSLHRGLPIHHTGTAGSCNEGTGNHAGKRWKHLGVRWRRNRISLEVICGSRLHGESGCDWHLEIWELWQQTAFCAGSHL